jgi:hypothetical protein
MIALRFDPTFSKKNTCFLLEDGFTLRCRIMEASSAEIVCDVKVRRRRPRPGHLFIRPATSDLDMFLIESAVVHPDLARCELQITEVPAWAARTFLRLDEVE